MSLKASTKVSENPRISSRFKKWLLVLALGLAGGVGYFWMNGEDKREDADELLIRKIVASEELILELTPRLDDLGNGLMNLQLPTRDLAGAFFDEEISSVGLRELPVGPVAPENESLVDERSFPLAPVSKVAMMDFDPWKSLLKEISYFEHGSFRIVRGEFVGDDFDHFKALVKFSGLSRRLDQKWMGLSGKQEIEWVRTDGAWKISSWRTKYMDARVAGRLLFSESLDDALPNRKDLMMARRSVHQEESVIYYKSGKTKARSFDFSPTAMNQKPAISVADVDGDGFDDIYVMVRLGRNLLLRNQGDGTFREEAEEFEIAVPGKSTCSIFADFDNDGDPDLVLGKALERCVYYENVGGWFREVEQEIPLPNLAVSMAAADYNNDGLLDLFIATYRPGSVGTGLGIESGDSGKPWPERFLSAENAAGFRKRIEHSRSGAIPHKGFLDQTGPPNVLLVNRGKGRMEPAPESVQLAGWKNTLQGSWGDFDGDGDPDLYVANDWAPDSLFRNDGEEGFQDVANEAGTNVFGFAMGASWGDYDNDGRQDLYVSNMYSKAGRRIMSQVGGMNPDFLISAEGNYLYRQSGEGTFSHVSGLEMPKLLVADSGWSWGGQFADLDNDTDLDLYALSGYFTAPAAVASQVDL